MPFELFVSWRYLRAKRKGIFAAVTTGIGIAGVTVGVAALIATLSVMNGFQEDIQKKVVGAQAHLTVYGIEAAEDLREAEAALGADAEIEASAPFALGQAILTFRKRTLGVVLKGIDPEREFRVNDLAMSLREGSWSDLKPRARGRGAAAVPGVVLGEELARGMGVLVGDEVVLVSPQSVATPMGLLPKMQRFRVAGLLHTGYYEYDSTTAWAELSASAKFLGAEAGATGLGARLKELSRAEEGARRLRERLGPGYLVRSYSELNRTLFAALKLEKAAMFIILNLIILVACLNIASILILRGVEKTRDIGLLKAMGATPGQVRRIFLAEGFLIGSVGMVLGLALGLTLCWLIKTYPIVELPADIYYLSQVPVSVKPRDVAAVTLMGLLLSLLATAYPAARAAKVDPVEAIHYG